MGRTDDVVVSAQLGRTPRRPWRVAARCAWGFPTVVISPSLLEDGTRFPDYAWLTCPQISSAVSDIESRGGCSEWTARLAQDRDVSQRILEVDSLVRELRERESGGNDACPGVGMAGQRDPLLVKCLHAHVALALAGVDDPIGLSVLCEVGPCTDARCGDPVFGEAL